MNSSIDELGPQGTIRVQNLYYRVDRDNLLWDFKDGADKKSRRIKLKTGETALLTYHGKEILSVKDREGIQELAEEELKTPAKVPLFYLIAELSRCQDREEFKEKCKEIASRCALFGIHSETDSETWGAVDVPSGITHLGDLATWFSFSKGIGLVVEDYEKSKNEELPLEQRELCEVAAYANLNRLMKAYPTTLQAIPPQEMELKGRLRKTRPVFFEESRETPACFVVYRLARYMTGEDAFYTCARCGMIGHKAGMSRILKITAEERRFLAQTLHRGFPQTGDVWLHNPGKVRHQKPQMDEPDPDPDFIREFDTPPSCYDSVFRLLERRQKRLEKGLDEVGKRGRPRKTEKTPEGVPSGR
jgi:hypothetical protein